MLKNYSYVLFPIAVICSSTAQADSIHGIWSTEPDEDGAVLHIEFSSCGENICGNIVEAVDGDGHLDAEYEHLGKKMIWDMQGDSNGLYNNGIIWAPDDDKTYRSKMQLDGNTLTVEGCVLGGIICRGQDWKRIEG